MPTTRPDEEADTPATDDGLQSGGTRGSSSQGGPEGSGLPEKDEAVGVNSQQDHGSRSTTGREPDSAGNQTPPRPAAPEPLPPGTEPADYVGGEKPHKTCSDGTESTPSGSRNEVM